MAIELTPAAVKKVQHLSRLHDKGPEACLRLAVVEGGCSGRTYKVELLDRPRAGDRVVESGGVRVAFAGADADGLDGLKIDYSTDPMRLGFLFDNPSAKGACSCGGSFSRQGRGMGRHKVIFQPMKVTVEVDEASYPYGDHGEPGSLLDVALTHGVPVEHACGGTGACGTCHVIVEAGMENLSEASDDEIDRVEQRLGATLNSRLACLAVVRGDVTIRIPE